MISYICLLATVFANLSCADDMDNSLDKVRSLIGTGYK